MVFINQVFGVFFILRIIKYGDQFDHHIY